MRICWRFTLFGVIGECIFFTLKEGKTGSLISHSFLIPSYYSAMTGQPPFLKYGEFDPDLLRGGSSSKAKIDNDDPSNHPLLPRPSVLIDQLILQSEILAQLHFQGTDAAGEKFISEVEGKWYKWSNDHSKKLLEPDATEEFYVRVHYHW